MGFKSKQDVHDVVDDLDVEVFEINDDPNDPDVIEVVIRGRLKKTIGRPRVATKQKDPSDDFDRAMKGLECISHNKISNNSNGTST